MTNASCRIKKGEFELCQKNGVKHIVEINIGFDGLTIAQSKSAPNMKLTLARLFLALAEKVPDKDGKLIPNPYRTCSRSIRRSTPRSRSGPPPTSGTRDLLHELFLEKGAEQVLALEGAEGEGPEGVRERLEVGPPGRRLRRGAGENDNVIVQKLEQNKDARRVRLLVSGGKPGEAQGRADRRRRPRSTRTSRRASTRGARRMYVYLKKGHVGLVPGLEKFAAEYVSPKAIGPEGYLSRKGLRDVAEGGSREGAQVRVVDAAGWRSQMNG